MSVKIYDGLKYTYNDLKDVGKFHRKLINIAQEHYALLYNQKISCFCLDIVLCVIAFHSSDLKSYIKYIVTRHFHFFDDEFLGDHVMDRTVESIMNLLGEETWDDNNTVESLFSLIKGIATVMNFLFVTDVVFRNIFQVKISLYYNDEYVLFIPHDDSDSSSAGTQGGVLHQRLMNITGVEEYHYQNSTDKPEDIPENDWEKRYTEWEIATSSFQQSMNFSNCSEILVNNPNQTNIIPIMYTLNKKNDLYYSITKQFVELILNRYDNAVQSIFKHKMESQVDISSFDQSKGWMSCFKYVNRMTQYMLRIHENRNYEYIERCNEVFVPFFNYFELK